MVPYYVKYSDAEKRVIAERYYEANMAGRKFDFTNLEEWCNKNLSDVYGKKYSFLDVIIALPEEIDILKRYWNEKLSGHEKDNELSGIEEILYRSMSKKAQKILFEYSQSMVCPYCNGNYIFTDERIREGDFDHYYPRTSHPLLAASFFNLVPACSYCNRLKGKNDIAFNPHRVYCYEELPHFIYWINNVDYLANKDSIEIGISSGNKRIYKEYINQFRFEDLYESHKDIVQDTLLLKQIYSDEYVNELKSVFGHLGLDEKRITSLVYRLPKDIESLSDKPLSKLIYEVWNA